MEKPCPFNWMEQVVYVPWFRLITISRLRIMMEVST